MKNKIKSAQLTMRIATVLRLLFIAVIAVAWAYQYADAGETLLRVYYSGSMINMLIVMIVLLLDAIFTLMWLYRPKLYKYHHSGFVLSGILFYFFYVLEYFNMTDGWGFLYGCMLSPILWMINLIPFLIYDRGRGRQEWEEAPHKSVNYDDLWKS